MFLKEGKCVDVNTNYDIVQKHCGVDCAYLNLH